MNIANITMDWLLARVIERDGCLVWKGYCGTDGKTPKASIDSVNRRVRVVVWEMAHKRKLPSHMYVGTTCHVDNCCRPEHLVGRHQNADRVYTKLPVAHKAKIARTKRANSKIPDVAVLALRTGEITDAQAVQLYGMSSSNAYLLRVGKSRRDYTGPFAQLLEAR